MQQPAQSDAPLPMEYDDEIDLRELFAVLWAGRKLIAYVTSAFAVIAVIVALMIPNQYKATAVVAPAQSGGSSMLGTMASQFGGLASLAGIELGGSEGGEAQEAMEIMQSWGFIETFIEKNNLAVEVFAAEGWNAQNNKLSIDSSLYDTEQQQWVRNPPSGKTIAPTSWELYEEFSERLSVSQDKKTGLVSVSVEYYSPLIAKQWVGLYIATINGQFIIFRIPTFSGKYLNGQIIFLNKCFDKAPRLHNLQCLLGFTTLATTQFNTSHGG